jgi:glutamate-5-semialdehyde dehydrogenase
MSLIESTGLLEESLGLGQRAQAAARLLARADGVRKDSWLAMAAENLRAAEPALLEANELDRRMAAEMGLSRASIDRLTLNGARVAEMAQSLSSVQALHDPVGEVVQSSRRPNGLDVAQVRVPLGVILFLYESRPNVTADAAALCVKSGNAVILRGGKEALRTNQAIFRVLSEALTPSGLPAHTIQLVENPDRALVGHLLKQRDYIDLAIPRGGESLIRRVAAEATMPVLKHYQGNCHVYVDKDADIPMAVRIVVNAKTQRPGVCNAAETLLVHRDLAPEFLPLAAQALHAAGVELRGDAASRAFVADMISASPADWDTEYLDLILAVAVVDSFEAAIDHIDVHGSGHTDAIVTRDLAAARRFVDEVDSACVVVNASTRFNDGAQLGLGAEIGISTDKFHARGPCGLRELTTTKWVVYGNGQVRT